MTTNSWSGLAGCKPAAALPGLHEFLAAHRDVTWVASAMTEGDARMAAEHFQVLLWDRPNCGASDVQFYGQSESHMRAETLRGLLGALGVERCIFAGGSGGARDSMLTTMLYPELVEKLVVWNIVGGVYGSFVLGSFYIIPSILAVRGTGMDGVAHGLWSEFP